MVKTSRSSLSGTKICGKGKVVKSSRSKISSSAIWENDFDTYFQRLCSQYDISSILNITVLQEEPSIGSFTSNFSITQKTSSLPTSTTYNVMTIYENSETKSNLHKIIIRNILLHDRLMNVLGQALKSFNTVTILKLEFCRLKHDQIILLKKILRTNTNITELSLTGNPNENQTFHEILNKTGLEYLSMRCCKINDRGIQKIANVLSQFDHPLVYLNLSGNIITSEGAKSLAKMLRVNRNIQGINLCDNCVTDEGLIAMMSTLKRFALTQDEIYIRRQRIFKHLYKRRELVRKEYTISTASPSSPDISSRKSGKSLHKFSKDTKSKTSRINIKEHSSILLKKKTHSATTASSKRTGIHSRSLDEEIDRKIGKDVHPFVSESTPINLEIICKGNLSLVHLNLSFNKLTRDGVQDIINTLIFQDTIIRSKEEGLTSIVLEGYPDLTDKLKEITQIIYHKMTRSFSKRLLGSPSSSKKGKTSWKSI